MTKPIQFLLRIILFQCLVFCGVYLFAEAPIGKISSIEQIESRTKTEQKISTAHTALGMGLTKLAERLLGEVLEEIPADDDRRSELLLKQVTALLALDKVEEALKILPNDDKILSSPEWQLRAAMVALLNKQLPVVASVLEKVDLNALAASEKSWYYYVKGHWLCDTGMYSEGIQFLDKAVENASTNSQRLEMQMAVYQRQIFAGVVNEALLKDLKQKTETFKGQQTGYRFAREYAVALYKANKPEEALSVVETQLKLLEQGADRDGFLLLLGMFSKASSGKGILALQDLVKRGEDQDLQSLGLYLLVQVWSDGEHNNVEKQIPFLQEILKAQPDHPLRADLLILLSQLAFDSGQHDLAREQAEKFVESFPQSEQLPRVLRLLAGVSILGKPPQYRTAATYLSRLRDLATGNEAKYALGVQMADSLFLAEDFQSAAALYETSYEAFRDQPEGEILSFQWVLSLIESGELEKAQSIIGLLNTDPQSTGEHRWRAEWNLVSSMQKQGNAEQAFARVRDILKDNSTSLPISLTLRFRWLEVYLSVKVQESIEVIALADNLLDLLDSQDPELASKLQLTELKASTLLLKIQALLDEQKLEEATPLIEKLRIDPLYSGSKPAQRSYLLEASYHFKTDDLVKAQQLSVMLADKYPENPLAPIALMQASQYAEKRGSDVFFQESLKLLERLASQYPANDLYFFAKLRQGHLFRKLNQFGNAQQIYSNLINQHSDHPMIHLALLANADCFLAKIGEDSGSLDLAVNLLERLFLQPDLPAEVVVEAGYKLAFAHKEAGRVKQAQEVLGGVLDQFLLNPSGQKQLLSGTAKYWMSRSILVLGTLLEDNNSEDEARIVYGLIEENNLPGRSLANARIEQLGL